MAKDDDWGEFLDPEQIASNFNKATTHKDIVMLQVKRISEIGSKQLTQGYVEKKIIHGQMMEKYHEDGREAYCNAIDMLFDLMIGECDRDKNFLKEYQKIVDKEKETMSNMKEIQDDGKRLTKWLNEKVKIRRELFRELSRLLHSTDWMTGKVVTDR